jgi:hypothetical protein
MFVTFGWFYSTILNVLDGVVPIHTLGRDSIHPIVRALVTAHLKPLVSNGWCIRISSLAFSASLGIGEIS